MLVFSNNVAPSGSCVCSESGEALVCSTTGDLSTGQQSLFKNHYLLCPSQASQHKTSSKSDTMPVLCALRMASLEELAPPPTAAAPAGAEDCLLPASLSAAVSQQIQKVEMGSADPATLSSNVHETVEVSSMEFP